MAIPDGGLFLLLDVDVAVKNMARTTGPSLMGEIFKISAKKGYRHYFYGSKEETLELLEKKLKDTIQELKLLECIVHRLDL